jgi:microcystin-dependent protein
MTATLRSPFNLSAHLRPTVGDQKISFTSVDHMGWLLCDGRELSITEYGLLFGVIGYTFDTDLSGSLFKLPDFRGTVPGIAGQPSFSNGMNTSNYNIGDFTGEQQHILTLGELAQHNHGYQGLSNLDYTDLSGAHSHEVIDPGHRHSITDPGHAHNTERGDAGSTSDVYGQGTGAGTFDGNTSGASTGISVNVSTTGISLVSTINHRHAIYPAGSNLPHNNMQPTLFGGNMFIYSGKNMQAYFPYTWVGGVPAANGTAPTPGNVLVF